MYYITIILYYLLTYVATIYVIIHTVHIHGFDTYVPCPHLTSKEWYIKTN